MFPAELVSIESPNLSTRNSGFKLKPRSSVRFNQNHPATIGVRPAAIPRAPTGRMLSSTTPASLDVSCAFRPRVDCAPFGAQESVPSLPSIQQRLTLPSHLRPLGWSRGVPIAEGMCSCCTETGIDLLSERCPTYVLLSKGAAIVQSPNTARICIGVHKNQNSE